jgi:hypothetical protein
MNGSGIPARLSEENPERLETCWNLQSKDGASTSMAPLSYRSLYEVSFAKDGMYDLRSPS